MRNHWQSVVFVDLDNTILKGPFKYAVFSVACKEIAAKTGLELEVARHLVKKENYDRQRHPVFNAVRAMDWDDIVSTIGQRLGIQVETNILESVQSYTYPPYLQLLDDADKVLRQLSRPHRAIVVATKGLKKYQMPVLDALRLTSLFTDILAPDSYNALKQNRSFYGRWPESTQLQIMVGDDYEDDILTPHQFGFKTVWKPNIIEDIEIQFIEPLNRPSIFRYQKSQFVRPDAIITTLRELPEVVTLMEEQVLQNAVQVSESWRFPTGLIELSGCYSS